MASQNREDFVWPCGKPQDLANHRDLQETKKVVVKLSWIAIKHAKQSIQYMNWHQHLIVSLLACHLLNFATATPWTAPLLSAAALGAWLPDVDHQKTRVFHFTLAAAFALAFTFAYFSLNVQTPVKLFAATAMGVALAGLLFFLKPRHRGVTHHWLAAVIFGALVYISSQNPAAALNGLVAYGTHLAADRL